MTKHNPFPVTEDNFAQCWLYVDKCRRSAKRKSAIANIGGFTVNLFFFLCLIFCACGLLHDRLNSPFRGFWESLVLFPVWEKTSALLLLPGESIFSDIGRLLPAVYVLSAAVFGFLAVMILLLYHPFQKQMPEGTYAENTLLLAKQAQEAKDASYRTRITTSIVATVLAIGIIFAILTVYILYTEDPAATTAILSAFPTGDYFTNCLIYVLFLYLIFHIFCSILNFITMPLYRYEFPMELVVQAQKAALFAREEPQDLSPEELEAKHRETAASRRKEALALETEKAYGKAKNMLLEAAIGGDIPAMEHYARHCLLNRMHDSANYWLMKANATGEASPEAKKMLLRLRLHIRHNVEYLKPEEAPLSTGRKVLRTFQLILTILWRLLLVSALIGSILLCIAMYRASTNPEDYASFSSAISQLLPEETMVYK